MATQVFFETLVVVSCANCGIAFGVTQNLERRRRDDHKEFFCPTGHSNYYSQESEAERLKRELQAEKDKTAREKHWREQAEARATEIRRDKEHVEHRLRGTQSVVTRMKRRTANGRCVCCSRQFKDLKKHMQERHPNWNPDRAAEAIAATNEVR